MEACADMPEAPVYAAMVDCHEDVGDHVQYGLRVTHRSTLQWSVWRRYSDFHALHDDLSNSLGEGSVALLPPPPQKSWLPSFMHGMSSEFCEQRHRDLQEYIDAVLANPVLARHAAVQVLLGVRAPEPPESLRILQRRGFHELQVRPCTSVAAAPVDGYSIQITDADTEVRHTLSHEVVAAGLQVQRAQIRKLEKGHLFFSVVAFNLVGQSPPVSIAVDASAAPARPPRTQDALARNRCRQGSTPAVPSSAPAAGGAAPGLPGATLPLEPCRMPATLDAELLRRPCPSDARTPSGHEPSSPHLPARVDAAGVADPMPTRQGAQNRESGTSWHRSAPSPVAALQPRALVEDRAQQPPAVEGPRLPRHPDGRCPKPPGGGRQAHHRSLATVMGRLRAPRPQNVDSACPVGDAVPGSATQAPQLEAGGDDDSLCVVCMAAPRTHAFVPCGHRCVCAGCSSGILAAGAGAACPLCRSGASQSLQIFT